MVVEVDADIYAGDPTKHRRRRRHKGYAGPRTGNANQLRVLIHPEGATVCREASDVKGHAVPVLGMGENTPGAEHCRAIALLSVHNSLKAAVTANTVIAKLTHGPQRIAPAMTTIAKSGQNDLPKASPARDRNVPGRRLMLRSCPLRSLFFYVLAAEKNSRPSIAPERRA